MVMMEDELYYNPQSNSLFEVIKELSYCALLKDYSSDPSKNSRYVVVTMPQINAYNISWHLKFDGFISKQNALEAAYEFDKYMSDYYNHKSKSNSDNTALINENNVLDLTHDSRERK